MIDILIGIVVFLAFVFLVSSFGIGLALLIALSQSAGILDEADDLPVDVQDDHIYYL